MAKSIQTHGWLCTRVAAAALAAMLSACGGDDSSLDVASTPDASTQESIVAESNAVTTAEPGKNDAWPAREDSLAGWMNRSLAPPVDPLKSPEWQSKIKAVAKNGTPREMGVWSPPQPWPLIAIHAALLPDGRVMTYGTNADGQQTGRFIYDVWDARGELNAGHLTLPNTTTTDLFCNAQTMLPSGDLFMAGGDNFVNGATNNLGNRDSAYFNPRNNTLSNGSSMNRPRWYATVTTMANADVYIQGGSGGADRPEVRGANGQFKLLSEAKTAALDIGENYPRNWLTQDDRIFGIDLSGRMYIVDRRGDGTVQRLNNLHKDFMGNGASQVMYAPGQILAVGANSARTARLLINRAVPVANEVESTSTARYWGNATVLPNGQVLMTGGSEVANQLVGVNNAAEFWDPQKGTWTLGASGTIPRLYHAISLLLPDGSVLVAGGGAPGPLTNTNAERYWPPYLFDSSGQMAVRPTIVNAPTALQPGQRLSLQTTGGVQQAALIRTGSITHSFDFDQRRIQLPIRVTGNNVEVQIPSNGAEVPPGYYMLFVMNAAGVPSMGSILNMGFAAPEAIGADWTGTIGGGGGTEVRMECGADEVLAGIHGRANDYLRAIAPRCVRVDKAGVWQGEVRDMTPQGATTGNAFVRTCPANSAVMAMRGRGATAVDRLELVCANLTAENQAGTTQTDIGAVGGNDGPIKPTSTCGFAGVGRALYGRIGGSVGVHSIGLLCRSADQGKDYPFFSTTATPVLGPTKGNDFKMSCNSDEVLVGVKALANERVNRLMPLCVKVEARGSWNSDVVGRGGSGGVAGTNYTRICPADYAVSGFTAQTSSNSLTRLTLDCRKLTSAGKLGTQTHTVGGVGGRASGTPPQEACGNDWPANGLLGRSSDTVHAVGLSCRGGA